ncbi:MAG: DUF2339 domain-containing protein, partial [Actinomycetota bacterium]
YGYVPVPAGLALLCGVAVLCAWLALRHDSQALALIAFAAGVVNPFAMGGPFDDRALLPYIVALDVAVLLLASRRGWHVLTRTAMLASWAVAYVPEPDGILWPIGWGTAIFGVFAVDRLLAPRSAVATSDDVPVLAANAFIYLAFVEDALTGAAEGARGGAAFAIAAVLAGLWLASRTWRPFDAVLARTYLGLSLAVGSIAVALQWDGLPVGATWSIEGILLLWIGGAFASRDLRLGGLGLVALGVGHTVAVQLELGLSYLPDRLLLSTESFALALQIAVVSATAWLLRAQAREQWEREANALAVVGAHALAIAWLSLEARAYVVTRDFGAPDRTLAFAYTGIWAAYAGVLFVAGILRANRRARLIAVALFGITLFKLVVVDSTLLGAGGRAVLYTSLGVALIACSLTYHRFKELVLGHDPGGHA